MRSNIGNLNWIIITDTAKIQYRTATKSSLFNFIKEFFIFYYFSIIVILFCKFFNK